MEHLGSLKQIYVLVGSNVVARTEGTFRYFCSVQYVNECCVQPSGVLSSEKWDVPPLGWYKLNVDAAVDNVNGRVGYGAVIRTRAVQVMDIAEADQGDFQMTGILQRLKRFALV